MMAEGEKKQACAITNNASIDLLCAFIESNFEILGSIPREIKQSPSGALISYASVGAGRHQKIKYANSNPTSGTVKHGADGHYLLTDESDFEAVH